MAATHPPSAHPLPQRACRIPIIRELEECLAGFSKKFSHEDFQLARRKALAEFLWLEKLQAEDLCEWKHDSHKQHLNRLTSRFIEKYGEQFWPVNLAEDTEQ
jgi:hypothetical protein